MRSGISSMGSNRMSRKALPQRRTEGLTATNKARQVRKMAGKVRVSPVRPKMMGAGIPRRLVRENNREGRETRVKRAARPATTLEVHLPICPTVRVATLSEGLRKVHHSKVRRQVWRSNFRRKP